MRQPTVFYAVIFSYEQALKRSRVYFNIISFCRKQFPGWSQDSTRNRRDEIDNEGRGHSVSCKIIKWTGL